MGLSNFRLNYRFRHDRPRKGAPYRMKLGGFRKSLPSVVDLRSGCSPIENQGTEGDCAAHATAGAIEFLELKSLSALSGPFLYTQPPEFGPSFQRVSRQQLYWGGRALEGTTSSDSGIADLADMATVCQVTGVARESLWPYTEADLFSPPPQAVLDDAAAHKLPAWYSLEPGYQLRHCLWSGSPFMLGFQVFSSFMTAEVAKTGEMPMPAEGEQIVGGHAVLAVGYDDARACFIVRNSWGGDWGIDGYFHMPYEFADSEFCGDFTALFGAATDNP